MAERRGARVEFGRIHSLFLAAVLTACGGKTHADAAPTDPSTSLPPALIAADSSAFFASGTRLKAHVLDGGNDARALIDFYDTVLGINCTFVENASGEYHCLPVPFTTMYFDADCTRPAFVGTDRDGATARPGLLFRANSLGCDSIVLPYSLVEEQPVTQLYLSNFGRCAPVATALDRAWVAQREPLARFASSALSAIGEEGEAQALRASSDDGAYVNLGMIAQGQPCTGLPLGQIERCVPTPLAQMTSDVHADDQCSGPPLAYATHSPRDSCAGRSATLALTFGGDTCSRGYALRTLLDTVPSPFSGIRDACNALDPSLYNADLYRVGGPAPSSDMPLLSAASIGSGALRLAATANRLGTPLIEGPFARWTSPNAEPCARVLDASGVARCAPGQPISQNIGPYADANCTRRVSENPRCDATLKYLLEEEQANLGEWTLIAAYVAEPYTGPLYQQQTDGCRSFEAPAGSRYFQRGAAVDIETFPVITETTDP